MGNVEEYYEEFDEWSRLMRHPVEFDMTKRMLDRFLPEGETVLDVGGGPGRYSIYLAQKGYEVTLLDISGELIRQAEENAEEAGVRMRCIKGDALELDKLLPGEAYEAVLCMGPLYHILAEDSREMAVTQCLKRLKTGGIFMASFISAYAGIVDCLEGYPHEIGILKSMLLNYLKDGRYFPYRGFTDAYFTHPADIEKFMSRFPLEHIRIMSADGPGVLAEEKLKQLSDSDFSDWLDVFEAISENREVWGSCEHMLYIGRKTE